ncbi:11822_t:CDS:2, partial [Scutellospora calospora]
MNYLKANTSRSLLLKVEPFTGDDILTSFLHGVADEWQTTFYVTQNTAGTSNW